MKNLMLKFFTGGILLVLITGNLFGQITVIADDAPSKIGTTFEMSQASYINIESLIQ